jgi:hypothetical protein
VTIERKSIMQKSTLLAVVTAAIAVFGAAASVAQEATDAPEVRHFAPTKTRAEVMAELRQAEREGRVARNEADVQRIADAGFRSQKSRAQVRAETEEARRLGLAEAGEGGAPTPTPEQLDRIRVAGQRALDAGRTVASK